MLLPLENCKLLLEGLTRAKLNLHAIITLPSARDLIATQCVARKHPIQGLMGCLLMNEPRLSILECVLAILGPELV